MNGIDFGSYLKSIRKTKKIPSKDLSVRVGKAVTYVSQLERGLIKKPDYETCFNLLKELNVKENEIEEILAFYNILSPDRIEADIEMAVKRIEQQEKEIESDPEGYAERQLAEILEKRVTSKKNELVSLNNQFHKMINLLIQKDTFRAERVLRNLGKLTSDVEFFDFFCSLFDYNYTYLTNDERKEILKHIGGLFDE
ncbi:helix-turn-helix domain-containing protein [Brevibacillus laterosporus]|uniref:helix-turn-helix domain-containing protein n=1 Tax=Brevibacillus laterosporus TaxID=1465 RepID=UPI003D220349